MSTQEGSSISFRVSANQQNLRLLELPSSLANLLRSDTPPSLFLKSAAAPPESVAALSASGNAVLCTDEHTFELRQVHSSNSIFVIQPSRTALNDREQSGFTTASVHAVAECATTLELKPSSRSSVDFVKSLLPQYRGPEDNTEVSSPNQLVKGKERTCGDATLSRAEFEAAWVGSCAFELNNNAMLPVAPVLHGLWKSILSATVVKGLKFDVNIFIQDIVGLVEEDGFPRSLLQAVVSRLSVNQVVPMEGWTTFSPDECIPWVGSIILEARAASIEGISTSIFLREWRDLLPEPWRERASLMLLEGKYLQPTKDRIRSHDPTPGAGHSMSSETFDTSGKRLGKWHEKFKNARR